MPEKYNKNFAQSIKNIFLEKTYHYENLHATRWRYESVVEIWMAFSDWSIETLVYSAHFSLPTDRFHFGFELFDLLLETPERIVHPRVALLLWNQTFWLRKEAFYYISWHLSKIYNYLFFLSRIFRRWTSQTFFADIGLQNNFYIAGSAITVSTVDPFL